MRRYSSLKFVTDYDVSQYGADYLIGVITNQYTYMMKGKLKSGFLKIKIYFYL